jgi:hypothetical protein
MKILRFSYSSKELSNIMDMSYPSFYRQVISNETLCSKLAHGKYQRWHKNQVVELFRTLGFPAGYEHYEKG